MDWIATISGWIATYLVGQRQGMLKNIGWGLWVLASGIWTWYGYEHGITGLMVSSIGYFVFEFAGLIKSLRK